MYAGFSPFLPSPISRPSLVARITLPRLLPLASHLPRIVSDSPPVWPGSQREYTSAVSIKFSPASSAASNCRKESASGSVHPYTLPPRQSTGTSKSDLPSLTLCMPTLLNLVCHAGVLTSTLALNGQDLDRLVLGQLALGLGAVGFFAVRPAGVFAVAGNAESGCGLASGPRRRWRTKGSLDSLFRFIGSPAVLR